MTFRPDLIALDLDGTLLNSAKEVTARTAAALQAAAAAGIAVVLASGRMYHHCMEPLVTSLGLAGPVICYNGAVVLDAASGEILSELPVPADLVSHQPHGDLEGPLPPPARLLCLGLEFREHGPRRLARE